MARKTRDDAHFDRAQLLPAAVDSEAAALEASSVARLMAGTAARMARVYREQMGKTVSEIDRAVWAEADDQRIQQLLDAPPEAVDWWALNQVAERDPELAQRVWEHLKTLAREELDSGHRAAEPTDVLRRPWDRARFFAMRQAFRDEWQPRGGIEAGLIDVLAHAQIQQLDWLYAFEIRNVLKTEQVDGPAGPLRREPTLGDAEARREAVEMVDRFNRLAMRTLRSLRELRRYPVIVQNAGQVNVADQQVNIANRESN